MDDKYTVRILLSAFAIPETRFVNSTENLTAPHLVIARPSLIVTPDEKSTSYVLDVGLSTYHPLKLSLSFPNNLEPIFLTYTAEEYKSLRSLFKKLFRLSTDEKNNTALARLFVDAILGFIHYCLSLQNNPSYRQGRGDTITLKFLALLEEASYPDHSVSFYASELCITRRYLTRLIKATLGMPPKKVINATILTKAKACLLNVDETVEVVAELLGFDTAASFSAFFKKYTRQSPSEFRKGNPK